VKKLVLLMMVGSVAMYALVLRTQGRLSWDTVFSEFHPHPTERAAPTAPKAQTAKSAAGAHSKRTYQRAAASATSAVAEIELPKSATRPVWKRRSQAPLVSPKALAISGDSVAVYAANSASGNVLTVLSEGIVVEPALNVLDSAGNWTVIRVPDRNVSGFVRTVNLALPSQAETNSP